MSLSAGHRHIVQARSTLQARRHPRGFAPPDAESLMFIQQIPTLTLLVLDLTVLDRTVAVFNFTAGDLVDAGIAQRSTMSTPRGCDEDIPDVPFSAITKSGLTVNDHLNVSI